MVGNKTAEIKLQPDVKTDAVFSPCKTWRYSLSRMWDDGLPGMAVIGLNPSVADVEVDDRTVAKLQRFARLWGFGSLCMLNLFAYRSTDRRQLCTVEAGGGDVIGPECNHWLEYCVTLPHVGLVLAAWGTWGTLWGRDWEVVQLITKQRPLHYLSITVDGHPAHPLYQKETLLPSYWAPHMWPYEERARRLALQHEADLNPFSVEEPEMFSGIHRATEDERSREAPC